jgi:two-component system, chemotaxis family, protein-glutamate methylesterase/glutaminase
MTTRKVRALIVDDSALIRQLLTMLLSEDPEIEVVGSAHDPFDAREKIKALNPDVVTLDVEMPKMDGLSFLQKIMELRPMPVVMISTLTQANSDVTIKALETGAVDFVAKPTTNVAAAMEALGEQLRSKVKGAARARVQARKAQRAAPPPPPRPRGSFKQTGKIAFVGASTGGVEALRELLSGYPEDCPPTLITQHMPERFTASFAARLNTLFPMTVVEAANDLPIEPGHVYIAPGGSHHLEIARSGMKYVCRLQDGPLMSGHRPSVDVLFRSAAEVIGRNAVGTILTGMGKDGADGLLQMRKAGATTFGQNEETSLIYGMPQAAFNCGAVMQQYPLNKLADAILTACGKETAAA